MTTNGYAVKSQFELFPGVNDENQAWYASVNALFDPFRKFRADYSAVPWATFVDPEVARVGLNEQEATERNIPFEVTRFGIDDLDRAIADGEAHGFVKVLTVPGKDRILSASPSSASMPAT